MEVGLGSTYKKTNSLAPGAGWAPGLGSGLFAGRWAVLGGWAPLSQYVSVHTEADQRC